MYCICVCIYCIVYVCLKNQMSSHVHTLIINFLCEFVNGRIYCNLKGWTIFILSCVYLSILKKKNHSSNENIRFMF